MVPKSTSPVGESIPTYSGGGAVPNFTSFTKLRLASATKQSVRSFLDIIRELVPD